MLIKTRKTAAKLDEEWDSMFEGGKKSIYPTLLTGPWPRLFWLQSREGRGLDKSFIEMHSSVATAC